MNEIQQLESEIPRKVPKPSRRDAMKYIAVTGAAVALRPSMVVPIRFTICGSVLHGNQG